MIQQSVLDAVAITGVGYTPISRRSGTSVLELATSACAGALDDAGLPASEVDGIATFSFAADSVPAQAVATDLGLDGLSWSLDASMGGQAPCYLVLNSAMAIASGAANNVLIYRALNGRSGSRVGQARSPGEAADHRYSLGFDAYAQFIALWARRYLIETSQADEELSAVPIAQRAYAQHNARAMVRDPLTYDDYLESPVLVEPFRFVDCTIEVDGACAVLVSRRNQASDLRQLPIRILSGGYAAGHRSGLDPGDSSLWSDLSRNYTSILAEDLWKQAGLSPDEVDMAQIYDCFSSSVAIGLEGLRLAERGGALEMIRSGQTGYGGRLPVNTNGGLLSEGYLHGMNTVAEGVLQLQGRGATAPAQQPETCVVTSGAMMDGSAMVLGRW